MFVFYNSIKLVEFQFWQTIHDVNRLDADIDDREQEVEDIAGLVVLTCPVVGIVLDERLLILTHAITLHNPFDGRLAVYDILVGILWDGTSCYTAIRPQVRVPRQCVVLTGF